MSVIFVEGLIIFALVLTGAREAIMNAIPFDLKRAIGVGIGLFITAPRPHRGRHHHAERGYRRISRRLHEALRLGDAHRALLDLGVHGAQDQGRHPLGHPRRDRRGAASGRDQDCPARSSPQPNFSTFFAPFQTPASTSSIALLQIFTPALLFAVFAVMLTDFFDTMGTVLSVGEQAGFADKQGKVPGIKNILLVDSAAASVGGLFGASSITTYIESAAGVAEGGRTGLTAIITGLLFAVAAFFAPVVRMVGGGYPVPNAERFASFAGSGFKVPADVPVPSFTSFPITAGALIIVGFLMMRGVREIPWDNLEEAFPAFLTIVGIPLTYNISWGIGLGFISYVVIKIFHGKAKDVHPLMWVASIAFLMAFLQTPILALFG